MKQLITVCAILAAGALAACAPNPTAPTPSGAPATSGTPASSAADSAAPTDAQIQAEIENVLTCAGKDDGFVTCTPPLTYSFGPIQRHGVMCLAGASQLKIPTYPINTTVQMTGNFSDGSTRPFTEGDTDQQTFFFRYSDYYHGWTATIGKLSNAFPCP